MRRVLQQASYRGIFDRGALDAVLARSRGRPGTGRLRLLLTQLAGDCPFPSSELERRFLELVRSAGLPEPVANGFVAGWRVDFHWPEHHLAVETDGRAAHAHVLAFETDRGRDLDLALAGWRVLRFSWRQVVEEPERVVASLRRSLALRGSERHP